MAGTEANSFEIDVDLNSLASLDFTSLTNQIHLSTHPPTHWTPMLASFSIFRRDASTWTSFGVRTIPCHGSKGFPNFNLNWVLASHMKSSITIIDSKVMTAKAQCTYLPHFEVLCLI